MKEKIEYIPQNETQKRIAKLDESDGAYKDSMYDIVAHDIAKKEGKFRQVLKSKGVDKGAANELADIYSDEVLEKFEANKERWTDGLTGLRNRKALDEELPQYLSAQKRQEKRQMNNCSFLMIDFDHFKRVNDEFGHLAGDQALEKLAKIIKNQTRMADIIYRYGGEEFVVFLPNTDSTQAALLAERIRAAVENTPIELNDSQGRKQNQNKTVSIGCVGTNQIEEWNNFTDKEAKFFLKTIVIEADKAMYNAKQTGRNRVIVYDEKLKSQAEDKENLE